MSEARQVTSADGTTIAVHESGRAAGPTIVAVHGYPDNHTVWDGVAAELDDRFRFVRYDVRGTGASGQPAERESYRIERLVEDLRAVLDAVSTDVPVHLLGHDWGSIQAWAAVTDPSFADRIASYTSISGPSLDHAASWLRDGRQHPGPALKQLAESSYIGLFLLPGVAEFGWRHGLFDRVLAAGERLARSSRAVERQPERGTAEKLNGLQLYRANMIERLTRPEPGHTDIPVQVLAPRHDRYVSVALQTGAPRRYVTDLRTRVLAGSHWVPVARPEVVARCVAEFVATVEGAPPPRELAPSRRTRAGRFAGQLVVVTGAASGIGRATALEFARAGADLVVADIDDAGAKAVAAQLRELGVAADSTHLDVTDRAQWEEFAAQVRAEHGVPDVVVNNAGIGIGGPFLATSVEHWEKILAVNVWGVIHGCRLFAEQQVQRGEGGRIVNIASAAAFAPSKTLPAYATTKAAVLMLSESLRAELAAEGISVTAVCPGFIDTNITRATTYVGVDDVRQDELREQAAAAYGRRNYTPERVARQIVRAAAANKPVLTVTPEAKLMRALHHLAPPLSRAVARVDLSALGERTRGVSRRRSPTPGRPVRCPDGRAAAAGAARSGGSR